MNYVLLLIGSLFFLNLKSELWSRKNITQQNLQVQPVLVNTPINSDVGLVGNSSYFILCIVAPQF